MYCENRILQALIARCSKPTQLNRKRSKEARKAWRSFSAKRLGRCRNQVRSDCQYRSTEIVKNRTAGPRCQPHCAYCASGCRRGRSASRKVAASQLCPAMPMGAGVRRGEPVAEVPVVQRVGLRQPHPFRARQLLRAQPGRAITQKPLPTSTAPSPPSSGSRSATRSPAARCCCRQRRRT